MNFLRLQRGRKRTHAGNGTKTEPKLPLIHIILSPRMHNATEYGMQNMPNHVLDATFFCSNRTTANHCLRRHSNTPNKMPINTNLTHRIPSYSFSLFQARNAMQRALLYALACASK